MKRVFFLFIVALLSVNPAFGFDEEKAKGDYQGAEFKVADIRESLYENAPAIAVSFTAPLSKKRLADWHASLEGGESEQFILSEDRTKLIFPFVSPNTEYTVHIAGGIRDVNGQKLGTSITEEVKTRELTPSVAFSSTGHILTSASPMQLPVTTVNIDEVNIDFFRIDASKVSQFIDRMNRTGKKDYYELNEIRTFGTLVHSGRFELKPKKNQRTEYNIDLSAVESLKTPGLYAAVMGEPGVYEYEYEYTFFMQSDIGLHVRRYENTLDVYAQDITTGAPLEGVAIDVVNEDGERRDKAVTDEEGRASFYIKSGQYCLLAEKGGQFSVLPLNRNALDLSGLKNAVTAHSEYQIFAWGPRDLYRPSEEVQVDFLVRDYDGHLPPAMPLSYTLYRPDGSKSTSDDLQPVEKGFYTYSYQTAAASQTGRYHLKLSFGDDNTADYYFNVEEVLPERLDMELFDGVWDKKRVIASPYSVEVPVTASYLYGAPASGNKVDGFVTAKMDPHPFENFSTYYFGDPGEDIESQKEDFREINLSDEGTGTLVMDNEWSEVNSPVLLSVNASVYESGGRPVTRRSSLTLLSGDHYIGIEPQFEGSPDADTTVDVKVGCLDPDGNWISRKTLTVSLVRQDRNYFWRHSSSRGWHWDYDRTPVVVFSKTITTDNSGATKVALPLGWGDYRVEVSDGEILTAYEFETAWSWWDNAGDESGQKPDLVSLGFDRERYAPGETARLIVNPPQDGLALVTVESSEEVLHTAYLPVKSEGTEVEIPIDENWNRHDLYASAMVIRPGDMTETPVPSRSFGMVHLPVQRENTGLAVAIDAPERVEPERTITATVTVGDGGPLPENTRVVVSLVDVGILNLTRYATPDPEAYFFAPRRYSVDLFDNYGQVIDNLGPLTARQRFGGGFTESDADLARGGDDPQSEVLMVSFFSDPLTPDENGRVSVSFDLPNFNGRLRWMVAAYSDEAFGSEDTETTVAARLVTQLSMPRFLALGDTSTLALDLRNMSGEPQALSLELTTGGSLAGQTENKQLILADKGKTTLRFPTTAISGSGQGEIELRVSNEAGDIDIRRSWRLGCRSAYPAISRSAYTVIEPGGAWRPDLSTEDLVPDSVQFQMTLSNTPPIDFGSHFTYLLKYPYGCLEQSTSSGYPWVLATAEAVSTLGLGNQIREHFDRDYDNGFRLEQIEAAVQLVLDRQKSGGGFGLWSSDSSEDKWLTVYATEFLHDAEKTGADVSASALSSANGKLRKYLSGNDPTNYSHWSEDPDHYEFAYRSYAGYVLATQGMASISDLRRLADTYRDETEDDGLSWLYMAAAFKLSGDSKNAKLCFETAMDQSHRKRYQYYGEYGSNVRDLARMAELALAHDFKNSGQLIFDLAEAVKERRWLSTQERICLFRTALRIELEGGETWSAALVTDHGTQDLERNRAFNTLFDLDAYKGLQEVTAGGDRLYAAVSLAGNTLEAPTPQSNEMAVKRTFYDINGYRIAFDQMKTGELAVVRLDVSAEDRTPDGLVVDLLPAGVEIENQNLENASVRLDDIQIEGVAVSELKSTEEIKFEEFREDRYVAAVDCDGYDGVTLFYLVRAVTPGIYTVPCSYVEDMYRPYRFAIGTSPGKLEVFDDLQ
jgi:uncharacterized protein YfaS (alpha-2-macroglobulin family)